MQFVRIGKINIHYQLLGGPENKPTLVFVNAQGTDFRIWRDMVVDLAGDWPILLYDQRGHGLSDVGASPYEMAEHVADLAALLAHLQIAKVVLCGVSVGSVIAQCFAKTHQSLVQALILCSGGERVASADYWQSQIEMVAQQGMQEVAQSAMQHWFSPTYLTQQPEAVAIWRNMFTRTPIDGYMGLCASMTAFRAPPAATLTLPVLCLSAMQDRLAPPSTVAQYAKQLPNAEFSQVAQAAQLACIEQPAALLALIRPFLTQHSASK